jgi:hypothetical protein
MVKQDRHIALLVDNCSAHPKDCAVELTNGAVYFLPLNVTSLIQPCDMGIIRNLKALEEEALNPPTGMLSSEFQTYVDLDISLECHGQLPEEDICTQILPRMIMVRHHTIDSDDDETSASASPTPKRGEAMQAMQMLHYFLDKSGADLEQFYTLKRQLLATTSTQTSIRDFFSPILSGY